MAAERYLQMLELLRTQQSPARGKSKLCAVAAQVTGLDGGAVGLVGAGHDLLEFCSSNSLARKLIDIESAVGQGPSLFAHESCEAVLVRELGEGISQQWSLYTPLVTAEGVRAVFAFPVQIGAVRLGALLLFRPTPGELTELELSDSFLMASMVARAILALQSGASDSLLSGELERAATFDFVLQQAAGMVAVQGAMSVHEALVLIRAHGFGTGSSSAMLAHYIVDRKLSYDPKTGEWIAPTVENES